MRLIDAGAKLGVQDIERYSALMYAIEQDNSVVAVALINAGAPLHRGTRSDCLCVLTLALVASGDQPS